MPVGLWVWGGVPPARAIARVPPDRRRIRRLPFARLLGTARGFGPRDADLTRWALLASFEHRDALESFETSMTVRGWDALAATRTRLVLEPTASRGSWSGRNPFHGNGQAALGPVVAVTRARLRAGHGRSFRRSVPPVTGASFAMGVGEWPVGLLGTVSLWPSEAALQAYAGSDPAHAAVVARTPIEGWYAEELYARFALVELDGTLA